jgi:hypothetical protein
LERADARVACGCFSLDLTGERLGEVWTGSLAGKEEGVAGATEVLAGLGVSDVSRKVTLEVLLGEAVGGVGGSARVGVRRMGGGVGGGELGAAGRGL